MRVITANIGSNDQNCDRERDLIIGLCAYAAMNGGYFNIDTEYRESTKITYKIYLSDLERS
jgi:hypothetical protein